ncbi:polysaccharide pyruvyl transferase family protein [Vibrio vulnificus]
MKLVVVGWYGTETIGDRAILVGILSRISNVKNIEKVTIGALNPFFTERTILEDEKFIKQVTNESVDLSVFNSKSKLEIMHAVSESDFVIMGGGPIMAIPDLKMVDYTIKLAKSLGKKTGIIGCGFDPLKTKEFINVGASILENSDIKIFRDETARKNAIELMQYLNKPFNGYEYKVALDPAIEAALVYKNSKQKNLIVDRAEVVINFRDLPEIYNEFDQKAHINSELCKFTVDFCSSQGNKPVRFVPMHYFRDGNDDRDFINKLNFDLGGIPNLIIQNEVLTLEETFDAFYHSAYCVGMRFHSVVLMTILNGNNYVLDYTNPNNGKIIGFLRDIDDSELSFYNSRYVNLHTLSEAGINFKYSDRKFSPDYDYIEKRLKIIDESLKNV